MFIVHSEGVIVHMRIVNCILQILTKGISITYEAQALYCEHYCSNIGSLTTYADEDG